MEIEGFYSFQLYRQCYPRHHSSISRLYQDYLLGLLVVSGWNRARLPTIDIFYITKEPFYLMDRKKAAPAHWVGTDRTQLKKMPEQWYGHHSGLYYNLLVA